MPVANFTIRFYKRSAKTGNLRGFCTMDVSRCPPLFIFQQQVPAIIAEEAETDARWVGVAAYRVRPNPSAKPWKDYPLIMKTPTEISDADLDLIGVR